MNSEQSSSGGRRQLLGEAARRLDTPEGLRRGLGAPALFGIVQAFIAASIYALMGVLGARALGLGWIALAGSGLFFVLIVLSYVEGASLHAERGGATVIARYGFNELVSFIAGWAICLDYLIVLALAAVAATDYAAVFWKPLSHGALETLLGIGIVVWVALVNIRGGRTRHYERAVILVLIDLAVQVVVVVLGLVFLFRPELLTHPTRIAGTPDFQDVIFAFTIGVAAFSGLDASSGLAGEVRVGRRGLRRLIAVRLVAAVVPYFGIALVALSSLPLASAGSSPSFIEAPIVAVVSNFDQAWLRDPLRYIVALSGFAILVLVANAAMLGLSRLGYSLALTRQIPVSLGRLHPTRATPFVLIIAAALIAIGLVVPADLELLAAIYAFGATIAFTIVHLSVCRSRWREPNRNRPFKIPLNVRVGKAELPIPAMFGALLSIAAFLSVVIVHDAGRFFGTVRMLVGVSLYVAYRKFDTKPILRRVTVPEQSLIRREEPEGQYGSILVPILGTPLDDDIVQTAGRLAGGETEEAVNGAEIEALWVIEVPLALPIDARLPEDHLRRARNALARAKAVGEEYEGVKVSTNVVRARSAGEAIVTEAKRKGVEAIVMAAEEPTNIRGGVLLGGHQGLRDTFVGETTRYVLNRAHCRTLLTAPASAPTTQEDEA